MSNWKVLLKEGIAGKFPQEAVKLVVEEEVSCREAAEKLSLASSTLAYWVKAYKEGKLEDIGKAQEPLTEVG